MVGKQTWTKYTALLGLIALTAISAVISDHFLTVSNLFNILRQVSINGLLATGMTFVIISKGINLSVGSILALSGVLGALAINAGQSIFVVILICIGVGCIAGAISGFIITRGGLEPFIVTLAMMTILNGLTLVACDGRTVILTRRLPALNNIGNGYWGPVPIPVVIMMAAFLIASFILIYTPYGRHIYYTGGNEDAAFLSGIPTQNVKLNAYVISGILAGLGGLLYLGRLGVGEPTAGGGFQTNAIAATVIGGTSMAGGKGGAWFTIIGVLIIGLIDNILNLMNVSPYIQDVFKGLIIISSVYASRKR
mgnify:CR=1 FL=1